MSTIDKLLDLMSSQSLWTTTPRRYALVKKRQGAADDHQSGPEGTLTALAIVAVTFMAGMVVGVVLSLVVVWMVVRG